MSIYRYTLSDYHAVEHADIIIDGITVLAGENGCGKSTLSRWLYYLINGSNRMDEFLYKDYIQTIYGEMNRMDKVASEIRRQYPKFNTDDMPLKAPSKKQMLRYLIKKSPNEEDSTLASDMFQQQIHEFGDLLEKYLEEEPNNRQRDRILSYLDLDTDLDKDGRQIVENFIESNIAMLQTIIERLNSDKEVRRRDSLFGIVRNHFDETDEAPAAIQLYEDDVELLPDDSVSTLFNLQRAIYVDTPMALSDLYVDNVFWKDLNRLVLGKGSVDDVPSKKLLRRIKEIIHGEARLDSDSSPFNEEELRYISVDNRVNITIGKTATGFKTFAYIQRLLENGFLNSGTLLLIDEPEAHLHPQWIVEYARLLVLISKELGLKVMLASHNPDMVAAIRAVAEKENMLQHTHFYIARKDNPTALYQYRDLGCEITEIFTSFNIALSRIKAYGPHNL